MSLFSVYYSLSPPPVLKAYFKELMLFLEGASSEAGGLCFTLHSGLMKNSKKRHTQKMLWPLSASPCLLEFLAVEEERIAGSLDRKSVV